MFHTVDVYIYKKSDLQHTMDFDGEFNQLQNNMNHAMKPVEPEFGDSKKDPDIIMGTCAANVAYGVTQEHTQTQSQVEPKALNTSNTLNNAISNNSFNSSVNGYALLDKPKNISLGSKTLLTPGKHGITNDVLTEVEIESDKVQLDMICVPPNEKNNAATNNSKKFELLQFKTLSVLCDWYGYHIHRFRDALGRVRLCLVEYTGNDCFRIINGNDLRMIDKDTVELCPLTMPVSLDFVSSRNTDWIVGSETLVEVSELCAMAIDYGKSGDWKLFESNFLKSRKVL